DDSDQDFAFRKASRLTWFDANPGLGEQQGTRRIVAASQGTGQWRIVTQPNGRKYMQHPSGRLFWARGVSGVHDGLSTPVQGRENYFTTLPSTNSEFGAAYSVKPTPKGDALTFSHHMRNLMVKYSSNYLGEWSW